VCAFVVVLDLLARVFGGIETLIFLALQFDLGVGHDGDGVGLLEAKVSIYR
jgi:hypothetical protein